MTKKMIVLMLLIGMFLTSLPLTDSNVTENSINYIKQSPFRINNNSDFSTYASSGDGSEENPWVIENYNISDEDSYVGIYIGNTTEHYILRNCLISNLSFAPISNRNCIYIYNSTNGIVDGNNVTDHDNGIVVEDSKKMVVKDNEIAVMDSYGIVFAGCSNSTAKNNYIRVANQGITFTDGTEYSKALNNDIKYVDDGIVSYSDNNFIEENNIANFTTGIFIGFCQYQTIKNNIIEIQEGSLNNVRADPCIGIVSRLSGDSLIDGNYISNTIYAIYSDDSVGNDIKDNVVDSNQIGIYVENSGHELVRGNIVSNNTDYGVLIDKSNNTNIYGNLIQNNKESGEGDSVGVRITSYEDSIVYHNNFINNDVHGSCADINNDWNAPYPIGGNYWDTYDGYDNYSGINQNIAGSDGFGDTSFTISGGEPPIVDEYPLMERIDLFPEEEVEEPQPQPDEEVHPFTNLAENITVAVIIFAIGIVAVMVIKMFSGDKNVYD
ncbi:hypothetical protein AKJ51_01500 [candidate division MSBL1 archaeon SCGC-AAA382A20]|uniref:Periplasmic copper-binding protein NosD beta helix domain-containing protein n=1 Tax=candidate division MSBL1 archaeon SCGC-AAA382A20 TaxID=1698280 RepID=A0A133VLR0_9EURY|nr:hypothetical protein AKJ51_01500 [candidate division MSBL1 archaeon SCGC-AAA382A20]